MLAVEGREEVVGDFVDTCRRRRGMTSELHTRNHPASGGRRGPPGMDEAGGRAAGETAADERERLMDEELDDTFPASDPPSWTMGGSIVSTLRH